MCQCLGQLWETAKYPLSCSLTPPPQWGRERKQDGKSPWLDKDREIAYQLLLWEKQTRLGENSFTLWRIKQIQVVRTPPSHSLSHVQHEVLHPRLIYTPSSPERCSGSEGGGAEWAVHSSSSLPLLLPHTFPLSHHGLSTRAAVLQEPACVVFSTLS